MDGATRHAQRLASNFLEDLETMQRESRARDRRAMSHFETNMNTNPIYEPSVHWTVRSRSISSTPLRRSVSPSIYYSSITSPRSHPVRRASMFEIPTNRARIVHTTPITMVGKSMFTGTYPSADYYNYYWPPARTTTTTNYYKPFDYNDYYYHYPYRTYSRHYYPYTGGYSYPWYNYTYPIDGLLPTSSLRAHPSPKPHLFTPKARDYVNYFSSYRPRSRSLIDLYDSFYADTVPSVVYTPLSHRTPLRSVRLGSVPPPPYRSTRTTLDYGLPSTITPRTYYKSYRYVTESPYYLTSYSTRTIEPTKPILSNYYAVSPKPLTPRYTYYYPSAITGKLQTGTYSNLSSDVQAERRRIERRMDGLLEYKLPPPEYYREMRGSLRALNDKLDAHRRMLDRYSGIDMNAAASSVQDRIESKVQQLASRMGRSSEATVQS